jgi:hypothetical protein
MSLPGLIVVILGVACLVWGPVVLALPESLEVASGWISELSSGWGLYGYSLGAVILGLFMSYIGLKVMSPAGLIVVILGVACLVWGPVVLAFPESLEAISGWISELSGWVRNALGLILVVSGLFLGYIGLKS